MLHRRFIALLVAVAATLLLGGSALAAPQATPLTVKQIDVQVFRAIVAVQNRAEDVEDFIAQLDEKLASYRKTKQRETKKQRQERRTLVKQLVAKSALMESQYLAAANVVAEYKKMKLTGAAAARRAKTLQTWSGIVKRYRKTSRRAQDTRRKYAG